MSPALHNSTFLIIAYLKRCSLIGIGFQVQLQHYRGFSKNSARLPLIFIFAAQINLSLV